MPRIVAMSRETFLSWISGGSLDTSSPYRGDKIKSLLTDNDCAVLLSDDPKKGQSTPIICVAESKKKEFLAFTSTYVQSHSPLTAFFRLLGPEEILSLLDRSSLIDKDQPPAIPESLVTVCIAEAFLRSAQGVRSVDDISVALVHATLSASLFSAVYSGLLKEPSSVMELGQRWFTVQRRLSGDDEPFNLMEVLELWNIVSQATSGSENGQGDAFGSVMVAIQELLKQPEISEKLWNRVTGSIPDLAPYYEALRGPREERTKAIRAVSDRVRPLIATKRIEAQAALGLALAMIGDGSMQYLSVGRDFDDDLSPSLLWYGLWSGLLKSPSVLTANNCLGRRAVRDLQNAFDAFSVPVADISFDELMVNDPEALSSTRFKRGSTSSISVELLPGVITRFRLAQDRNQTDVAVHRRRQEMLEQVSELGWLLARANQQLAKITTTVNSDANLGSEKLSNRKRRR